MRPKRLLTRVLIPLLATTVVAGAAWTGWRAHAGPPPAVPAGDRVAALHAIIAQPPILAAAEGTAVRDCLRRRGFDPPAPQWAANGTANIPVFVTEATARMEGYGAPADGAFARYSEGLPDDRRRAFEVAMVDLRSPREAFTTPDGWTVRTPRAGCLADARRLVYGSLADWLLAYAVPQDLNDTAASIHTDAHVVPVLGQYGECMRVVGYRAPFPQDAVSQARAVHEAAKARRIAIADARCQATTHLRAAFMAAFDRRSAAWLTGNVQLVLRTAAVVNRATARLNGHPGTN